ncbi:MAG TPA: polysaccharide pyruvyl transferase family protein [Xanthobacteraceae bacterium]
MISQDCPKMDLQTLLAECKSHPERRRIALYGHFGVGNLGNECTLQVIIDQIRRRWPDAELLCFCTNPHDVRTRYHIEALPAAAVNTTEGLESGGGLKRVIARLLRIAFQRIPLELIHWTKILCAVWRMDMLIVAGTGIVSDHGCGPLAWPYQIFKLSALASLRRVRVAFLSVGVGPLRHPLSRWFIKKALPLAYHRSYRDQASKQYLETIGFSTAGDSVGRDVAFSLVPGNVTRPVPARERIVGLGLKDYGPLDQPDRTRSKAFREYLNTMATFVIWLQQHGYGVRLLIGDIHYDTAVVEQFVRILSSRHIPATAPLLIAEPAQTVPELLRQIAETDVVISSRYHNLVLGLVYNKPIIALSDHPKLDSLATDLGLARYLLPLATLRPDILIERFKQLESDVDRLTVNIRAEVIRYRQVLDSLYATLLATDRIAGGVAEPSFDFNRVLDPPVPTDQVG